jgi:hypothetical protein
MPASAIRFFRTRHTLRGLRHFGSKPHCRCTKWWQLHLDGCSSPCVPQKLCTSYHIFIIALKKKVFPFQKQAKIICTCIVCTIWHMYMYIYIYTCTYVYTYICIFLSICLSIYLSIYDSIYPPIYLSAYLIIYLLFIYVSMYILYVNK